ncbi:acetyl-CoA carboxylase biotin carboxyl carrier protein [Capillimicrobium parvum]|uniref:Biotin carboxyl carrier protein of acetyl-CoA carboxylase n=1 Tax=Capillimicrobium parvum TaxID=2884022 RepID=A0A9E6Y039_9ACTN|nr:acetyl-CoA carboxylase biotin carboxyl carrier protein [Capillimicrobium parvum]UGS36966.1 Biotin carboxyl carrier protein of acetyl-CoA carboxylase [Capillimicrobium parvum]
MEMNPETIRALLDAFDRSDWQEMTITVGSDRLHVSRDASSNGLAAAPPPPPPPASAAPVAAAPAAPAAPAPPAAEAAPAPSAAPAVPAAVDVPDGATVDSPSVGLFWRAPAPGAPPFVEVGQTVSAGDTVAIVEVMKLMNHVVAPVDGTVAAILVDNGAPVEYGQTLVVIDPAG